MAWIALYAHRCKTKPMQQSGAVRMGMRWTVASDFSFCLTVGEDGYALGFSSGKLAERTERKGEKKSLKSASG